MFQKSSIAVFVISFSLTTLLGACASPQLDYKSEVTRRMTAGNWVLAYASIEVALGAEESAMRLWAYDLIVANQPLRAAATASFSEEAMKKAFMLNDPITAAGVLEYRLSLYQKYASDEEVEIAKSNIQREFKSSNAARMTLLGARRGNANSLIVTDLVFNQLNSDDQSQLRALYPQVLLIPQKSIGKISSVQIIDKSRPGSTSGSQLGSALGQAAYIDRALSGRSYSAVGQIGAGIVGAALGSSLNKSPSQHFIFNYGVQLADGSVTGVVIDSSDSISAPVGQCVFVADAQEAPGYLCSDSVVGFLERAAKSNQRNSNSAKQITRSGVKCRISAGATLTLTTDECKRLDGEVVSN